MILPPASPQRCPVLVRRTQQAFTLIELLAVITIILILAGLILSIAGNAQYKGAISRATAEIHQMSTAMENYKIDNGAYPRDSATSKYTDTLNAQVNFDPTVALYTNASAFLFQQLSGFTGLATGAAAMSKTYITFLPGQLSTGTAAPTAATWIIDPFGFSYGYSTINQLAQDNFNTNGTPMPTNPGAGYNPTFDLWSTASYTSVYGAASTGGKNYPATATTAATIGPLWAKNW